jgi:hypothetical protein
MSSLVYFKNDFLTVAPLEIEPKMGHTLGYGTHLEEHVVYGWGL